MPSMKGIIEPGDVVVSRKMRLEITHPEIKGSADVALPKGKVGIFLLLGIVDADKADAFDPVETLIEMGYIRSPGFVQSERDKQILEGLGSEAERRKALADHMHRDVVENKGASHE